MATSGTRTFNPTFAEILSEAFSRCLIRPADVTQEHIDEAIRSANLMLVEFSNRGVRQYQLAQVTQALTIGIATYSLPVGTLDVWSMIHRKNGTSDTPVWPISRQDYHYLPDKTTRGRPYSYFVERGKVGNDQRTVTLWPVPEDTDEIIMWLLRRSEDATAISENLSSSYEWFDAYAAKLAARLAEKYAPAMLDAKVVLGEQAFMLAQHADRERAPARLRMTGYTRGRRF